MAVMRMKYYVHETVSPVLSFLIREPRTRRQVETLLMKTLVPGAPVSCLDHQFPGARSHTAGDMTFSPRPLTNAA